MREIVVFETNDLRTDRYSSLFDELEADNFNIVEKKFFALLIVICTSRAPPVLLLGVGRKIFLLTVFCWAFNRECWIRLGGNPVLDKLIRSKGERNLIHKGMHIVESYSWRWALKHFSRIFVVSDFLAGAIRNFCRESVVFNVVPPVVSCVPLRRVGNVLNDVRVYTLANFSWMSKRAFFVEIIQEILGVNSYPDLHIDVYGEFFECPEKERLIRCCSISNVNLEFKGMTDSHSLIPDRYDLFIYFSEHDSFGLSVREAAESGIQVFCNAFDGFSDLENVYPNVTSVDRDVIHMEFYRVYSDLLNIKAGGRYAKIKTNQW